MFLETPMFLFLKLIPFGLAAYGIVDQDINYLLYAIFCDSWWRDFYTPAPLEVEYHDLTDQGEE